MYTVSFVKPLQSLYAAYTSTYAEIPLIESKSTKGHITYQKDSQAYIDKVNKLQQSKLNVYFQDFLNNHEIRKDLIVMEQVNAGFCAASGTNYFTNGDARVFVAPGLFDLDTDVYGFAVKHELGHIKNNDMFACPLIKSICGVAVVVFSLYLRFSFIPTFIGSPIVTDIIMNNFFQYVEGKADDFALETCSNQELEGGRRFLKSAQNIISINKNSFESKTFFSRLEEIVHRFRYGSHGEDRLNFSHPTNASRLQKIEKRLIERGVKLNDLNTAEEILKIKQLTSLIISKKK